MRENEWRISCYQNKTCLLYTSPEGEEETENPEGGEESETPEKETENPEESGESEGLEGKEDIENPEKDIDVEPTLDNKLDDIKDCLLYTSRCV